MPKEPDAFFLALEADLPPVIAIGGAERVYVDDATLLIRARALAGGMADFNHDRVSARERDALGVLSLARTFPVMAKRRLVEVRDAGSWRDADVEALEAYLDAPSPETVLLLVFGDIDLRDKLVKLVDKKALLCRFDRPKERDMPSHVVRRAKRHKLMLSRDAIGVLAQTVGADLTLLERALEKLALVATAGVELSAQDVAEHVADTHIEDAFAFVRAVAKQDRAAALAGLSALQAAREEPLRLLGLLAWQLRQVATARAMLDDGSAPDAVGRELSLFGDRLSTTLQAARAIDMRGHAERLAALARTDQQLKKSRAAPWLLMTALILELCPTRPRSTAAGSTRPPTGGPGGGAAPAGSPRR